jgi:hypothetical protein
MQLLALVLTDVSSLPSSSSTSNTNISRGRGRDDEEEQQELRSRDEMSSSEEKENAAETSETSENKHPSSSVGTESSGSSTIMQEHQQEHQQQQRQGQRQGKSRHWLLELNAQQRTHALSSLRESALLSLSPLQPAADEDGGVKGGARCGSGRGSGDLVMGQYDSYKKEKGVKNNSQTATFANCECIWLPTADGSSSSSFFGSGLDWSNTRITLMAGKGLAAPKHSIIRLTYTESAARVAADAVEKAFGVVGADADTDAAGDGDVDSRVIGSDKGKLTIKRGEGEGTTRKKVVALLLKLQPNPVSKQATSE